MLYLQSDLFKIHFAKRFLLCVLVYRISVLAHKYCDIDMNTCTCIHIQTSSKKKSMIYT